MPIGLKAGRTGNKLLDRLGAVDLRVLAGSLRSIELPACQVLCECGEPIDHIYFPVTSLLTLSIADGLPGSRGIEFTSVGSEGMVGLPALLGAPENSHQAACHAAGVCWRIPTRALAGAIMRRRRIDALVRAYAAFAYRVAIQAALCNAIHSVRQRVCRWLLATHDKAAGEVPATQDLLAAMLGVKRPTISVIAGTLQKAGIISYHRGVVRVLDVARLEQAACACYQTTRASYDRAMLLFD